MIQWLRIHLTSGDTGSIPGQGTKMPPALGELSSCTTTTEPMCSGSCASQLESPATAMKDPTWPSWDPTQPNKYFFDGKVLNSYSLLFLQKKNYWPGWSDLKILCRIQEAWGWCTGMTQRYGMGRVVGGGFRMGNMCTPVTDACWCMAKPIQYCKVKNNNNNKI